jgi:hypothetical protein
MSRQCRQLRWQSGEQRGRLPISIAVETAEHAAVTGELGARLKADRCRGAVGVKAEEFAAERRGRA